jgi:hypothetical protein
MYAKYLLQRVKYGRTKLWEDWKQWRNSPGMQYRDIYGIYPGSYTWRYFSPSSIPIGKESGEEYIKEDYKTPYRKSSNYMRKITPESDVQTTMKFPFSEGEKEYLNKYFDNYEGLRDYMSKPNIKELVNPYEGDLNENVRSFVRGIFSANALRSTYEGLNFGDAKPSISSNYTFMTETVGNDKSLDVNEGNGIWEMVYFDTIQALHDYDDYLKEEYDYKVPVYVGRTKKWQVVNDSLGKKEVDKIQIAIGAPVQEQLDLWEEENEKKYIQMPINNENHSKFRDRPLHYERLDHDYEMIIYERKRNTKWEKERNSRYWLIEDNEHEHGHGHNHGHEH